MWRQKIYRALRASEPYFKTDMVYLARGGFWLTASQIIGSLSGLILTIAFANLLSPETYGLYRYTLSIIGILVIATFPGIDTAAIKGVAQANTATFWKLLRTKATWSLTSTGLGLLLSLYYFFNNNNTLGLSAIIIALGLPLVYTTGMYSAWLSGIKDFRRLAQWSSLVRITTTLAMIVALIHTDSLFVLLILFFTPEAILQALYLWLLRRQDKGSFQGKDVTPQLTSFGFHLSMMEILKTIASQIDKVLVFHYLGASQLALYTIATTAPGQIKGILQNMSTLALPKFSNSNASDIVKTLPQKLLRLEIVIISTIILYWIAAPIAFPVIFPQYQEGILASQVYALSLIFFPRTFLSTAMTAHLKKKELYAIRILAPLARIAIFAVALPWWGFWGAIIGSIVGHTITALIYQYYYRQAFSLEITTTK